MKLTNPVTKYYYYLAESSAPIRVRATQKPKGKKTYIVHEFDGRGWHMACFPEISGYRLEKLKFIGISKEFEPMTITGLNI